MAAVDREKLEAQRVTQRRLVAALPRRDGGEPIQLPRFEPQAETDDVDEVEELLRDLADRSLEADDVAALEARIADGVRRRADEVVSGGSGAEEAKDDARAMIDNPASRPRDAFDKPWNDAMVQRVRAFLTLLAAADAVAASRSAVTQT